MKPPRLPADPKFASELNNVLQVISGTSALIENIWQGTNRSEKYFAMLRAGIERAEQLAAQLVVQAGGTEGKVRFSSQLEQFAQIDAEKQSYNAKPCVMVVDDEPMTLTLLRRLLTERDYQVAVAQSGFECLDIFRRVPHAYDLVLLDLAMPFMDGEETFQRLREMSPTIDVVLMAGFIETDRLDRMLGAGLTGFLAKPFGSDQIFSLAGCIFERAEASRSAPAGIPPAA